MTRAAVYVRLSQETAETTSPARQRESCEKLIAARGWDYSREQDLFEDIDFSAWSGKRRPAFTRLRDQLGRYDAVVYWKLDRLARNVLEYAEFMRAAEGAGVTLVAVSEGEVDTDTPTGRAMSQVSAVFAELESATISLRIRSAQEHMAKTGRWRGGTPPFGWRTAPHPDGGKRLEVHPENATLLRDAVAKVIGGSSCLAIAEGWNRRGVTTSRQGTWTSKKVLYCLRNPRLIGQRVHRGQVVTDDDGVPLVLDPPIIDRQTWDALQRAVTGRDLRTVPGRRRGSTLLAGVLVCGRCGGGMVGWTADHPGASYACATRSASGTAVCVGNAINRARTDELVEVSVLEVLTPAMLAGVRSHLARQAAGAGDTTAIRVGELEDAIDRLETDRVELGLYDDPAGRRRYADRMRRLTQELSTLRSVAPERPSLLDVVGDSNPQEAWSSWPPQRKRAVIRSWVDAVVIGPLEGPKKWDPRRVDIRWRTLT